MLSVRSIGTCIKTEEQKIKEKKCQKKEKPKKEQQTSTYI